MVVLILGSNTGDKLGYLRQALTLIQAIPDTRVLQVSPVYRSDALLPDNAPISWDTPYFNVGVRCETQQTPHALLQHLKTIEYAIMGRKPEQKWGPRIIDIDIAVWDDLSLQDDKLHIPHKDLHLRPFALWPLTDVAPHWVFPAGSENPGKTATEVAEVWGSRLSGDAPFHTCQIPHRIDTARLMGILNIAPDSFSDGGQFMVVDKAIQHAKQLVDAGAEIIDIGAEATGPNATPLTAEQEWQRLEPILKALLLERDKMLIVPRISIDTYHPETAEKALGLGVDWINDVSGLDNPAMCQVLKNHTCDIVVMHHLGIPVDKQVHIPRTDNITDSVLAWAQAKLAALEQQGIARERIIFDVGNGYGKTREQSLTLMKDIAAFKTLGVRLFVGHSRKVFLTLFTSLTPQERDLETAIVSLYLSQQNTDYLRVHNVEMTARCLKVAATLF